MSCVCERRWCRSPCLPSSSPFEPTSQAGPPTCWPPMQPRRLRPHTAVTSRSESAITPEGRRPHLRAPSPSGCDGRSCFAWLTDHQERIGVVERTAAVRSRHRCPHGRIASDVSPNVRGAGGSCFASCAAQRTRRSFPRRPYLRLPSVAVPARTLNRAAQSRPADYRPARPPHVCKTSITGSTPVAASKFRRSLEGRVLSPGRAQPLAGVTALR